MKTRKPIKEPEPRKNKAKVKRMKPRVWLRWGVVSPNGQLVAGDLCTRAEAKAFIYHWRFPVERVQRVRIVEVTK